MKGNEKEQSSKRKYTENKQNEWETKKRLRLKSNRSKRWNCQKKKKKEVDAGLMSQNNNVFPAGERDECSNILKG